MLRPCFTSWARSSNMIADLVTLELVVERFRLISPAPQLRRSHAAKQLNLVLEFITLVVLRFLPLNSEGNREGLSKVADVLTSLKDYCVNQELSVRYIYHCHPNAPQPPQPDAWDWVCVNCSRQHQQFIATLSRHTESMEPYLRSLFYDTELYEGLDVLMGIVRQLNTLLPMPGH